MFLRLAFFSLMVVGLVGFATVAWLSLYATGATPATAAIAAKTTVLTAARPLCAGAFIASRDIASADLTVSQSGADPILDTPEARLALAGASVRRCLAVGDAVAKTDIVRPDDRDFVPTVLAPGARAVSLVIEAQAGKQGLAWAGDHVDLILTQTFSNPDLSAGRRIAAETVARDVRVLAIDRPAARGSEAANADIKARNVTLEVSAVQAERVLVAARIGQLSLSIHSAQGTATPSGPAPGRTTWASDVSPALGANVGPAPRSTLRVFQGVADGKEFQF